MTISSGRRGVAARMGAVAETLLSTCTDEQRLRLAWPFDDDVERRRWYYTPTDHGGLSLADMDARQQQLAHQLLAAGTSTAGYATVAAVMGLENVLDLVEDWAVRWGRVRGRDPLLYFVRIFGDPGGPDPWGWRFGGHHISLNHTVVDGEVVGSTPFFLGADPADAPLLGPHLLRPLAGAEDLGRELARSLDEEQWAAALLSPVAPVDLVTANRPAYGEGDGPLPLAEVWRGPLSGDADEKARAMQRDAEAHAGLTAEHIDAVRIGAEPRGLSARRLSVEQRDLMRDLLEVYVARVPDQLADIENAKYASDGGLDALTFAWAGSVEPGVGHYYRIEGPRLLAEYDNTQRGANHIHTVWRDPAGDFGHDVLRSHYDHAHHRGHGR